MEKLSDIRKYFYRYKTKLLLGFLFILISNVTQIVIPLLLKKGIDAIQHDISTDLILRYSAMILGAALVSGFFRFLIRETIIVVSREIEYDIRYDFWAHLQKLSSRFYHNNTIGNLMAHATNDISAVRMFVGPAVMYSFDTITKFVMIIAIIFSFSWELTIYTLLPLPLLSYFMYKISKQIHSKYVKIQEKFSDLTATATENFSGIRVIKSYVREAYEIEKFTKMSKDYLDRNMERVKIQALFMPILFLISGLSLIIVVVAGGKMVIDETLTIGTLSAFMMYLGFLIWPMIAFGWILNIIQQADASTKRLGKIYKEKFDITDSENTKTDVNKISGKIEFKNVSFRYEDDLPYVLKDINITVNKGETVAFIGHTGSGKSTILNLIPRLYDIKEGEILIDGTKISEIPLTTLRQNIGVVPQETFLFSDTIENNILYGVRGEKEGILENVAGIARIDKDVENFPKGYDTILGERGITLSGGQKQRTCLARALAIDPEILILDDSFSAVDTNTEEEILVKLKSFLKDRTSIIVSHRISTVKDADKIFVLDDGKIVEEGNHEKLVEHGGIYADLHFKQLLEEELKEI